MQKPLSKHRILSKFRSHLTPEIINTFTNFGWRIIAGPLTMIFIPLLISPQSQGYWYTFGSLAALSVFADLGFTTIVAQFSAHEFAYLKFDSKGKLEGDEYNISRIGSLLKFVMKWASVVSLISFPIILTIGIIMFSSKSEGSFWIIPWILYVMSSGFSFVTGTILSFYEGCNQIASIQKNRFIGSLIVTFSTWIMLFMNFGLYSLSISAFIGMVINIGLLFKNYRPSIKQLFEGSKGVIHNWRSEFFKLIWRYAISWSSGYFIFQIYTPLMFQYHGAEYAGKVGISMTLCSAIFTIANAWVYIYTPRINMCVPRKDWKTMDKITIKSVLMSSFTYLLGAGVVLITLLLFSNDTPIINRFLGVIPMSMLLAAWFLQIIVNGLAVYLRAHKKEPLVVASFITAIYIAISTFLIANYFDADYLFVGFLSSYVFGIPWILRIFVKKRKEWHSNMAEQL